MGAGGVDLTVNGRAAFYNVNQGAPTLWVDLGGGRLFILQLSAQAELESPRATAQQLAEIALSRM